MSRAIAAAAIGLFLLADPIAVRADNVEAFAGGQADLRTAFSPARVWLGPGRASATDSPFRVLRYRRLRLRAARPRCDPGNFSGEELDAVYGITLKHIWNDLGVGVNATYTRLSPVIPRIYWQVTKRSFG